ncbi:hypothetical protein LC087_02180 [Bacillus carboniphilus]|uniref:Membrane protein NfeD2 N-terminal transmembrane domain-containing protein n=1 Tax=Bacillus carboniphilus TaxID=86663 RepID=A0ABY9JX16_9BACI|nr:hypothetical protein [Bacillus carboniphilus]WLR43048.1 hypothetical protein LC087_02180 [Bacillus carboniphilus]
MELFGSQIESIYLIVLIVSSLLTVLYIFFGDIIEGMSESTGFLNPTLILSFFTFLSAIGYILEKLTPFGTSAVLGISIILALALDTLLNYFVLIPLSNAEESLVYTEDSLKGRVGRVITSIPKDGFGEVLIESYSGAVAKSAVSFDNIDIASGENILVIDVINGVLHVTIQESFDDY